MDHASSDSGQTSHLLKMATGGSKDQTTQQTFSVVSNNLDVAIRDIEVNEQDNCVEVTFQVSPEMDAKVPTKPPFTAHISNLPRDVEVEDVLQVFKKVKAVRLCKPRGCLRSGFMEFENREQLITALCMNMRLLIQNRAVRVEIAYPVA